MGETAALLNESFAQARTVRAYRLEAAETARAGPGVRRAVPRAAAHDPQPRAARPDAGGAGRHRGGAGDRLCRLAGGAGRRRRSATSPASSPRCCSPSQPLRALGSLNAALQEGLAGLARVFARDRRAAGDRRAARRGAAAAGSGPGAVRATSASPIPDGRDRAARPELRGRARADRGAGRPVRRRQEHGAGADPAPAGRAARRASRIDGADVRDVDPGQPARRHRLCRPGHAAVRRHGGAPTSAWAGPAPTDARGRGRRGARRGGRVHRRPAGRLRDPGRTRRRPPVRRAAAARGAGPRAAAQPAHPAAGRGDQRARRRERGGGAAGAGPPARGPHDDRGRAPPFHRARRRPGGGDGRRRRGGAGHACRAAGRDGLYARLVRTQALAA